MVETFIFKSFCAFPKAVKLFSIWLFVFVRERERERERERDRQQLTRFFYAIQKDDNSTVHSRRRFHTLAANDLIHP